MPLGQYLLGVAFFTLTVGAVGVAAALIVSRRFGELRHPARGLAFALLWLAGLVLAILIPAAATVLSRGTVLVTAVLVPIVVALIVPSRGGGPAPADRSPDAPESRLSCALAALGVGVLVLVVVAFLVAAARTAIEGNDYLTFTMPNLGRWIQSGSLWMSNQFTPLIQTSTYPNNGDLIFLTGLLPWHDDALVRLVNVPLYALLGTGIYALARELGARRTASLLLAALVLSIQDVSLPALQDIKPDTFMLATLAVGMLFLVRHHRTRARSDLLLAGLGLGLAFGSRWYGISTVIAVLVVWAAAELLARRPLRSLGADAGWLAAMVAIWGGFWLVRNWVVTGNPIYPVNVAALGLRAPRDPFIAAYNLTVLHYLLRPGEFVHHLLPLYRYGIGVPGWILAGATLLALLIAAVLARGSRPPERRANAAVVLTLIAGVVVIVAAFVITPASAQGPPGEPVLAPGNARWALGAAIPAAAAGAWAATRLGRLGLIVELAAVVGICFGLHEQFGDVPASQFAEALVVLALAGALTWIAVVILRRPRSANRRLAIGAGAALLAAGAVAAGAVIERRVDRTRYANADPALRWLVTAVPSGHRVGIAGVWIKLPPTWAAFGPRLGNRVGYVGSTVDHMLVQSARRPQLVSALRRGGYDLVVLGRGWYPLNPFQRSSPLSPTTVAEQAAWIRSAGYRLVAAGEEYLVYSRT
jgi:4-amino-4-deoxy-L-arabinose transferase-like glycosyltransferase